LKHGVLPLRLLELSVSRPSRLRPHLEPGRKQECRYDIILSTGFGPIWPCVIEVSSLPKRQSEHLHAVCVAFLIGVHDGAERGVIDGAGGIPRNDLQVISSKGGANSGSDEEQCRAHRPRTNAASAARLGTSKGTVLDLVFASAVEVRRGFSAGAGKGRCSIHTAVHDQPGNQTVTTLWLVYSFEARRN
jgi:hypothetical protein